MKPSSILEHLDRGDLWPEEPDTPPTDVAAAYWDALAVRALRIARGERPVGYKIGFTNRTIWQRYRVFAPIWGTVWDTTLTRAGDEGIVPLGPSCQPRLEPEVAFGFARTPPVDASLEQLFDSLAWLAPSFEVVQSHRKDWQFTAAETIADGGLHARLLIGTTMPIATFAASGEALDARLAAMRVRLYRDETLIDEGVGSNVLDGPLHALHHFVGELQRCPRAPSLMPGDVVTTGTWTDAWPIEPGQRWRSVFDDGLGTLTIALQ